MVETMWVIVISFYFVMTGFVKKLVKWCKQNGTTSSSSLNVFGKPLKFLRTKLKILELHQNKFQNNTPNIISPMWNLQNDKKKIKDSTISKYKNKKLSKFTWRKTHTRGGAGDFESFLFYYFEVPKFSNFLLVILLVFEKHCVKFRKGRKRGYLPFLLWILKVFCFHILKFQNL